MAAAMQGWNLTLSHPLTSFAKPLCPCWAILHPRPTFFPAFAAGGKGFGELLKQRKSKEKEKETPVSSLSPSRGFSSKKGSLPSKEDEDDEASLDAGVDNEAQNTVCSCGGGENKLSYTECCMPYHNGLAVVPDGLTLLRARFSAYARGIVGYVARTTHPENPDFGDNLLANVQATCEQLRFYKLDIISYEPISNHESTVSFRVIYGWRKGGQGDRRVMEEKSYFVCEGDTWLFRDGEALSKASEAESSMASPLANRSGSQKAAAGFRTKSSSRPRKS
eukprot:c11405_g1_i1 orf=183-1016(-)